MKPVYARKETPQGLRKIMLDMAFLSTHKQIRFPKYYMEEGLFVPYLPDKKDSSRIDKFLITKENTLKEDENFYYYKFPYKAGQVEDVAV